MSLIGDLKEELNDLVVFKYISSAFTEASAVKLKNIRHMFERNAAFYDEITHVYHLVEVAAEAANMAKVEKSQIATLSVALSSNARFFGSLNIELLKIFISHSEQTKTDQLVIGKTGINYLKSIKYPLPYDTMVFARDNPSAKEISEFLNISGKYDRVLLYFPQFVSFLTQKIGILDITQRDTSQNPKMESEIHILFEPELPKILAFFETQVRLILFTRVLLETDLARTAARLLAMSQAEEHADLEIRERKINLSKVIKSFLNAQLLETFSSVSKWQK